MGRLVQPLPFKPQDFNLRGSWLGALELLQGDFKDGAAMASRGQRRTSTGCGCHQCHHLVRVRIADEGDAIALMEGGN